MFAIQRVCVCVCTCVCETERERKCVCVCVRERERELSFISKCVMCERQSLCDVQSNWLGGSRRGHIYIYRVGGARRGQRESNSICIYRERECVCACVCVCERVTL